MVCAQLCEGAEGGEGESSGLYECVERASELEVDSSGRVVLQHGASTPSRAPPKKVAEHSRGNPLA